jgi:hypothetical protein
VPGFDNTLSLVTRAKVPDGIREPILDAFAHDDTGPKFGTGHKSGCAGDHRADSIEVTRAQYDFLRYRIHLPADAFEVARNVNGGTRCAELAETLGDCIGEDWLSRGVLRRRSGPGSRSARCGDEYRVAAL